MKLIQSGLGLMGAHWVNAVHTFNDIEYVAFVEPNTERARSVLIEKRLPDIPVFSSLADALESIEADALLEVTPPFTRHAHARLATDAGIPVIFEKPLADTMANAHAIVQMANESGLPHMIAQNYRYKPENQSIKWLLENGDLGKITAIQVEHYRGLVLPGFHMKLAHTILQDMSIHHFDLMRFFLESEPLSIYGRSWNPPWSTHAGNASVTAIMEFPEDVVVTYAASWVSQGHPTSWSGTWRFECENGVILMRDDEIFIQRPSSNDGHVFAYEDVEYVEPIAMDLHNQTYLLREFMDAIEGNSMPATSVQDNIQSLQMVFDVIESCESGHVLN